MLWSTVQAADPVPYTLTLAKTGNAALDAALAGSSQLLGLRKTAPAGPFALVARARQDRARLQTALESFGFYGGHETVTIAGRDLDDPGLPDALQALPAGQAAPVDIGIETGPVFRLGRVALQGQVPARARAAFTLRPGQPAVASSVLGAGTALLAALQEQGYALARVDPPVATLRPDARAIDVSFAVSTGPRVDIGAIGLSGLQRMNGAWLHRRLTVRTGQQYSPSKIEAARQDLAGIGVFSSVQVRAQPRLDARGRLPLDFAFVERPLHAVSIDAGYSTDLGGSLGVTWSHRDLFGHAEQLNVTVAASGVGGTADRGLGYNARVQFLKPDYYRRNQTLELDVGALKQDLEAYNQTAATAGAVLTRKISARWSASVGVTATQEQIVQEGVTRDYTLLAVPLTGRFDGTGLANPLDDPTHGLRATLAATPTVSLGGRQAEFVILQGTVAGYVDLAGLGLGRPGRTVLAARALVGSAQGASEFDLPPDQRFYAGGSATVRGYKYQSVGPLFADGNPVGGTAIDAFGVELRQRIWGNVGGVVFADAAQVSTRSAPFGGHLQEGFGVGARYYTPIGPVRVDIALPATRPPHGDSFELYLGLGQAF